MKFSRWLELGRTIRSHEALAPLLSLAVVFALLSIKFSFLFSSEPITGWDTLGHRHLAGVYGRLFSNFDSVGYDPTWFGGFPVFYFYPPFFYFLASQSNFFLQSPGLAFNLLVFSTLIFFSWAFIKYIDLLLEQVGFFKRFALIISAITLYFTYAGKGTQATSLIGFINGTVVSTFALGIVFLSLYFLESYRRKKQFRNFVRFILSVAILFYTHYLSLAFCYLTLTLYFLIYRKSFKMQSIFALFVLPLVPALPMIFVYLKYSAFTSGGPSIISFPVINSLLGIDILAAFTKQASIGSYVFTEFLVSFKWLHLVFLGLYVFAFKAIIIDRSTQEKFIFVLPASFLFMWISQDSSVPLLLFFVGIHWYRIFDLAFALYCIVCTLSLSYLGTKIKSPYANIGMALVPILLIFRFLSWDFMAHEGYASMKLNDYRAHFKSIETALQQIPRNAIFLPEKVRNTELFGSPHSVDYLLSQNAKKNALGLTIESSLSSLVTYGYLLKALPHVFVWGIDSNWLSKLHEPGNEGELLPEYLERAGVQYVIGRTATMHNYLNQRNSAFEPVFFSDNAFIYKIRYARPFLSSLSELPIGFASLSHLMKNGPLPPKDFLLYANQTRILLGKTAPIINLDQPASDLSEVKNKLSAVIIFNSERALAPSHSVQHLEALNLPLILVNFEKTHKPNNHVHFLYTIVKLPAKYHRKIPLPDVRNSALLYSRFDGGNKLQGEMPLPEKGKSCTPVEIKQSFFPDWQSQNGEPIFQTDTNQMLMCPSGNSFEISFHNSFSKIITVMLYALTIAFMLSFFINRRKISLVWRRADGTHGDTSHTGIT